ncbi:hypothetical protein chiPu_0023494, partial [Chiloscyllium punctatum]|nr:hypothetical protein [Chiloscyllium punctatum]
MAPATRGKEKRRERGDCVNMSRSPGSWSLGGGGGQGEIPLGPPPSEVSCR